MAHRGLDRAQPSNALGKLVTKAVLERGLIREGDRILLGLSGGKDSTSLAWALSTWKRAFKADYTLSCIHIATEFSQEVPPLLLERLESWGIKPITLTVDVLGRVKAGEKMNCYWCSTQRRTELIKYALENGYTSIALGHHLDDILETFLMNLCDKGTLSTMPARLQYRKYPLRLIRPLAYVEERQIIRFMEEEGLLGSTCKCGWGDASARKTARSRLEAISAGSGVIKRRMLAAIGSDPYDLLVEDAEP